MMLPARRHRRTGPIFPNPLFSMLLKASAPIYPGIHLITLGATCRYVITDDEQSYAITNPGASAHIEMLPRRLHALGIPIAKISRILLTSLDAAKVGGLAGFRRLCPQAKLVVHKSLLTQLEDQNHLRAVWEEDARLSSTFKVEAVSAFDDFKASLRPDVNIGDSDTIEISSSTRIKCISTPGYQEGSCAYIILPHDFLIVDETFGFFRGRELPACGADSSLAAARSSLGKFEHLDVSGIGLPYSGAVTGALVRKHLDSVSQNISDIAEQVAEGLQAGLSCGEIREQIREAFYAAPSEDPFLSHAMQRSFEALCHQMLATDKP